MSYSYDEKLKMFNENLGLVYTVVYKHWGLKYVPEDDLLQEGFMNLWLIIDLYNPDSGTKFATYAYVALTDRLTKFTLKYRYGSSMRSSSFQEAMSALRYAKLNNISVDLACDALGFKGAKREYALLMAKGSLLVESLSSPVVSSDQDCETTLEDIVPDAYSLADEVCEKVSSENLKKILYTDFVQYCIEKHTGKPPDYFEDLVKMYLDTIFNDEHISQNAISKKIGVSNTVVSKHFKCFKQNLKQFIIQKHLISRSVSQCSH